MPTKDDLRLLQSLPLEVKVAKTKQRIREWVTHFGKDGVYVSFSGGKDSTVLLDLARRIYHDIPAVFVDTGLEYPEIREFVKTVENVTWLRPEMNFKKVIETYGYPIIGKEVADAVSLAKRGYQYGISKLRGENTDGSENPFRAQYKKYAWLVDAPFKIGDECCSVMKKKPAQKYEKETGRKPILATMCCESAMRQTSWLRTGCNAFDGVRPKSQPMSFWTEQDVLQYIKENNIPIASVYGDIVYAENPEQMSLDDFGYDCGRKLCTTGCNRTGCIFCAFGAHLDKKSRFERLKKTHPRQYEYCIGGGEYVDGVWQPSKDGLGMGHVFDELNRIYGDGFIRY